MTKRGFSLIELLVSMSIFSVVVTMSVGTMLILIDANNKTQHMNNLMTNLNFALSSMSREIRTGYNYNCGNNYSVPSPTAVSDCGAGKRLSIIETDNSITNVAATGAPTIDKRITYYYDPNGHGPGNGAIMRKVGNQAGESLTGPDIDITGLTFKVFGSAKGSGGDTRAPRVLMLITGTAGDIEGLDTSFRLQTFVTQRIIDL